MGRSPPLICTGMVTWTRRRPDTGLRARTANPSLQRRPARTGGVCSGIVSSKRARPATGSTRVDPIAVTSLPAGQVSIRRSATSAGPARPRSSPSTGPPATVIVPTSSWNGCSVAPFRLCSSATPNLSRVPSWTVAEPGLPRSKQEVHAGAVAGQVDDGPTQDVGGVLAARVQAQALADLLGAARLVDVAV